jgi:DNA-binding response OmpR family regulator
VEGPLGKLLIERGILPGEAVEDALARQAHHLPLASQCYVLGLAAERPLAAALAAQNGVTAVVLDECVIRLAVLAGVSVDVARRSSFLPVYEDDGHVVLASASPRDVRAVAREIERIRDKRVDVHIALDVTLARTIRAAYAALARGDEYWVGTDALVDPEATNGRLALAMAEDLDAARTDAEARAHRALIEDVTKEMVAADLLFDDDERPHERSATTRTPSTAAQEGWSNIGPTPWPVTASGSGPGIDDTQQEGEGDDGSDGTIELSVELDQGTEAPTGGPARILIVDDDFATRHLLVKELQPLGYLTATAASGGEAMRAMRQTPPDLVVADILLPEIDGFRLCRAIKRSRRLAHVPVVLMSAVIDSGRVTDEVLARYGADAYLEKPLDTRRVHRVVREQLGRQSGTPREADSEFARAIQLYQSGDVDGAIMLLRKSVSSDPSSAKHRFVLANLLQRKSLLIEAIDEYEMVIEIEPEYFPALTRLAYLYYKQGHLARAIDTWRRSLPVCEDPGLRRNIELFMRKLIAEMHQQDGRR